MKTTEPTSRPAGSRTRQSSAGHRPRPATNTAGPPTRRPGTLNLELQSGYKFGLAIALGAAAIFLGITTPATFALLPIAALMAWRALTVLTAEPSGARSIRPREHADSDGLLAAALAIAALLLVADGAATGALVAAAGAATLAGLRLRTRYVAR